MELYCSRIAFTSRSHSSRKRRFDPFTFYLFLTVHVSPYLCTRDDCNENSHRSFKYY